MLRLASLLTLLLLLIAGCGDDDDTTATESQGGTTASTATGAGTTETGTTAGGDAIATVASVRSLPSNIQPGKHGPHYFDTPSHNIGCYLSHESVRCDIRERSWSPPPKPKFCIKVGVDWGQGIGLGKKGAEFVCAGDTVLGGPGLLPYGSYASRASIACYSREAGITCQNLDTRRGFFLSRERYLIF